MNTTLIAHATIMIDAPREKVWDALVDPAAIKQYFFGATVISDWHLGSPIIWKGEWQGNPYEDKGVILKFQPGKMIQYSHFSPLSGLPDKPENYHTVTIEVSAAENLTKVSLSQDHNATEEERVHSEQNWGMMMVNLKKYLED
jgi:uncharacterized protein YndB with AHSA1/START domain